MNAYKNRGSKDQIICHKYLQMLLLLITNKKTAVYTHG